MKKEHDTDDSRHTRRNFLAGVSSATLVIGGLAGYFQFIHDPPMYNVEITDGSEYVTDVTIPNNGESVTSSVWGPEKDGLQVDVSDAIGSEAVMFELRTGGESVGWSVVREPPGTANPDIQITPGALPGTYTVLLYGIPEFGKWGKWEEEDDPSNRPPDAEAQFRIVEVDSE